MTDKQIIIEDCPHFIGGCCQEYLDGVCENHKCDLKIIRELEHQFKAKEQECEAYKMEADEGKEINAELKAENKHLNDLLNQALKELEKTRETLTEIKEIAEKIANYYDGDEYELMRKDAEQILQKISEVIST